MTTLICGVRSPDALLALPFLLPSAAYAADISLSLANLPDEGTVVLQVYDHANAFGNFRGPTKEVRYAIRPGQAYTISDAPEGEIAVLVYLDENDNQALVRNFIGIPREPVAQ